MIAAILLAALADAQSVARDRLDHAVAVYDKVCLQAFPDDKAVEAAATSLASRELTPAEVRVTMNGDPAKGWALKGADATLWLEFPPFHACSVRWNTPAEVGLGGYTAISEAYQRGRGAFQSMQPLDQDQGDIHIHAVGVQRVAPSEPTESLFFFEQHITDEKKRAEGQTGFVLRFVHQFMSSPQAAQK